MLEEGLLEVGMLEESLLEGGLLEEGLLVGLLEVDPWETGLSWVGLQLG